MAVHQTSNQRDKTGGRHQATQTRPSPELDEPGNYGSIGEMAEQASEYVSQGASEVREFAREHQGGTVVVALATGFGIGLLVGRALGISQRQSRRGRDRYAAEGLGRRLLDRFDRLIPDAIAEHFGK